MIRIRKTDGTAPAPDIFQAEELCQCGLLVDQLDLHGGGVQAVQHVAQQHAVPAKYRPTTRETYIIKWFLHISPTSMMALWQLICSSSGFPIRYLSQNYGVIL